MLSLLQTNTIKLSYAHVGFGLILFPVVNERSGLKQKNMANT